MRVCVAVPLSLSVSLCQGKALPVFGPAGTLAIIGHARAVWKFPPPARPPHTHTHTHTHTTAVAVLDACIYLDKNLEKVTLPFIVLHGGADTVTEPEVGCASLIFPAAQRNVPVPCPTNSHNRLFLLSAFLPSLSS